MIKKFGKVFRFWQVKVATTVLLLVLIVIGGYYSTQLTTLTSQYTNKTDQQQWDDMDRVFSLKVDACHTANGVWVVGFASAYCTVGYQQPDFTWYVAPQSNATWEYLDILSALGFALAMVAFVGVLSAGPMWVFD